MNTSIIFVYKKDDKIKVLDLNRSPFEHEKMKNEGYKHTATLDVCMFIENLYNEVPDEEIIKSIKSIAI
jgi:hypothetical protein